MVTMGAGVTVMNLTQSVKATQQPQQIGLKGGNLMEKYILRTKERAASHTRIEGCWTRRRRQAPLVLLKYPKTGYLRRIKRDGLSSITRRQNRALGKYHQKDDKKMNNNRLLQDGRKGVLRKTHATTILQLSPTLFKFILFRSRITLFPPQLVGPLNEPSYSTRAP